MYILVRLYYTDEQSQHFLGINVFDDLKSAIEWGKTWKFASYDGHDIDDYYFYIYKYENGVTEKVFDGLELDYEED